MASSARQKAIAMRNNNVPARYRLHARNTQSTMYKSALSFPCSLMFSGVCACVCVYCQIHLLQISIPFSSRHRAVSPSMHEELNNLVRRGWMTEKTAGAAANVAAATTKYTTCPANSEYTLPYYYYYHHTHGMDTIFNAVGEARRSTHFCFRYVFIFCLSLRQLYSLSLTPATLRPTAVSCVFLLPLHK